MVARGGRGRLVSGNRGGLSGGRGRGSFAGGDGGRGGSGRGPSNAPLRGHGSRNNFGGGTTGVMVDLPLALEVLDIHTEAAVLESRKST